MNPELAQRQLALAGVALLAIVAAAVLVQHARDEPAGSDETAAAATDFQAALAAPYSFEKGSKLTACGLRVGDELIGLAHPVLPCGAKIEVRFGDHDVLTQVVDRGAGLPGREFDLTPALADRLELTGVQRIEWRFATPPEKAGS